MDDRLRRLIDLYDCSLRGLAHQIADANDPDRAKLLDISVIVPCYNGADYAEIFLESLARQTLAQERFEVICVDDCSTDRTIEVLESYCSRIANLRIIRHTENRKQGAARNSGLDIAQGKYVFFLDSDDFLRLDALEILLNSGGGADVIVGQHVMTRFDKPTKTVVRDRYVKTTLTMAALENEIGWWPFGMLVSRELLIKQSIRFRENVYFEDIDFNIRIFLSAESYFIVQEAIYYYVVRDSSTVNTLDEKKILDSVTAVAEVANTLLKNLASHEQRGFFNKASDWLTYQAGRLRDCPIGNAEKEALTDIFVRELKRTGLLPKLAAGLEKKIRDISNAAPVTQAEEYLRTIDGFRYNPWREDLAPEFAGKVIFYCEVDYHIRSAAPVVRALKSLGIESIIVDASRSTNFTANRPLPNEELPLYADLDLRPFNVAERLPFATDAAAFVFMNDTTYTRRLIFENFGFGVPTFGFYEGVNDDWNLDRTALRRPYRSVDYLLLPGIYQLGFYRDRECHVIGLPNVRSRLVESFGPPRARRAIINVNFTYGVLEDRRNDYITTAVQACRELGLDYVITQHPADKSDLSVYNVADRNVYDLLDEGMILISRFSTTILEALAMKRPVVYHNPIGEKVPKFAQPLGAYSVSYSVASLKEALRYELDFVDKGGDMHARAALFLHFHCHSGAQEDSGELAAKAIFEALSQPKKRFDFKIGRSWPIKMGGVKSSTPPASSSLEEKAKDATQRLLRDQASFLLLDPATALRRIAEDARLQAAIGEALAVLPTDDPLVQHFQRIKAFAQSRAA